MPSKLVSIIVPVYKVEKYLDRCLESILGQTYKNLEVILVDDGSPDNSPKMCDEWAKKDKRIKVVHKENGGVSSARNEGLKVASGEYIQFVDSDDYIRNDYTESMVNKMCEGVDLVVAGFEIINDDKEHLFFNPSSYEGSNPFINEDSFMDFVVAGYFDTIWNKLYRKKLIKENFRLNFPLGEDREFNLKYVLNMTGAVAFSDSVGYTYEFNMTSACHKDRDNICDLTRETVNNLKIFLEQKYGKKNHVYYKWVEDYISLVIKKTPKNKLKEVKQLFKEDEIIKDFISEYKPVNFKSKLKKFLISKGWFNLYKGISLVKNSNKK